MATKPNHIGDQATAKKGVDAQTNLSCVSDSNTDTYNAYASCSGNDQISDHVLMDDYFEFEGGDQPNQGLRSHQP